jgi:hypothetical protein
MATVDEMQIKVSALVTDAIANLQKVQSAIKETGAVAETQSTKINKTTEGFAGYAKSMVKAFAAVEIVNFLKQSAAAASNTNAQFAIFAQTMHNITGATTEQSQAMAQQITQLGLHTNFMAADLIPSFDRLYEVTRNASESINMLSIAEDVAASKHVPLMQATQALAKAQDGIMFSLNRLAPETKDRANWLEILTQETKGAAEAAAKLDPYKSMQVAFQNIQIAVGQALLPALQKFADWMVNVVPVVQNFFKQLSDPTTKVGKQFQWLLDTIIAVIQFVLHNIKLIAELAVAYGVLTTAIKVATTAQWLLDAAMGANPIGAVTLAVLGLVAALGLLSQAGAAENASKAVTGAARNAQDSAMQQANALGLGNRLQSTKSINQHHGISSGSTTGGYDSYTAQQIKQLEKERLASIAEMKAYQKSMSGTTSTKAANAEKSLLNSLDKIHQNILDAKKKYFDDLKKLETDYSAKIVSIQQDFAKKLLDVINQSKALLTDAFQQAAGIDVGAMFAASFSSSNLSSVVTKQVKDGLTVAVSWWGTPANGSGISGLIQTMTDKLNASTKLAQDTGALAGQGFSQNFIDQIVSQGTDLGDKMAQAILAASPDQQAALKELYAANEQIALHGVDTIATQLYNQQGLATEALKTLYAQTETDFATALKDAQDQFNSDSADLYNTLVDSLDKAQQDLTDALKTAADAMGISVTAVATKYSGQVDVIKTAITDVKTQAKEALDNAQSWAKDLATSAFNDTLTYVQDHAANTITALKAAVDELNNARAALGVGPVGADTLTPKTAPASSLPAVPFPAYDAMSPEDQAKYRPITTPSVTINTTTSSSAYDIARMVQDAIKLGMVASTSTPGHLVGL